MPLYRRYTGADIVDGSITTDDLASAVDASLVLADSAAQKAANLTDLASASSARTALGLGSAAVMTPTSIAADAALTGTYAAIARRADLEASLRVRQATLRTAVSGASVTASAASAATGLAGGTDVLSITNTTTGAVSTKFRFSRAVPVQFDTNTFSNTACVSSGIQTYKSALDMLVEFDHGGATTMEVLFQSAGSAFSTRYWMDGQPINPTVLTPNITGGAYYYVTVVLPDAGWHRIGIELGANARFRGVRRDSTATIAAPADPTGKRLIAIGDSYVAATGAAARFDGFATEAGRLLGIEVVSSGAGGTGYLQTAGGGNPYPKYRDRIASDVTPLVTSDTSILVTGGQNDLDQYALVGAEAALLFAALKTAAPSAKIGVLLPFVTSGDPGAGGYVAMREGIQAAAVAAGITVVADPQAEGWITGTGYMGALQHDGNADFLIYTDHAHPSADGHKYYGLKLAAGLIHAALV